MKIAFDIRPLFFTDQRTGVEEYIYQLAYHLPRIAKDDQFIFFYNSRGEKPSLKILGEPHNVTLVNFKKPNRLLSFSFHFLNYPKLEKLIGVNPDIVLLPNYRPCALCPQTKNVMVFHDLSYILFPELLSGKNRLWHYILRLKARAKQSDHLIAVSEATKNDLIRHYQIPAQKITTTLLGLSKTTDDFSKDEIIMKQLGIKKPFIFTLGTQARRKNLKGLITAFKIFKKETGMPQKLVIAGRDSQFTRKENLSATKDLVLLDYISETEKNALYRNCEFFVLPSFYEGFGLPVLEAMNAGAPVITSNISALPEVAGNNALLVNPTNLRELTEALKALAQSPELRQKLAQKGREQSKKFTWEKCARETLAILRKVANS